MLVSHAATIAIRTASFGRDEPLDAAGRRAAAAASSPRWAGWPATTSPARAARQTADALGLAAAIDPALRDADWGRWTGLPLEAVAEAEPQALEAWLGDPEAAPHGGESLVELATRVGAWLDGQAATPGPRIAVTHASVVRAAVVHALGAPARSARHLDVAPLTAATLHGDGRRWTLTRFAPLAGLAH